MNALIAAAEAAAAAAAAARGDLKFLHTINKYFCSSS